jgi:hypothetical protein
VLAPDLSSMLYSPECVEETFSEVRAKRGRVALWRCAKGGPALRGSGKEDSADGAA